MSDDETFVLLASGATCLVTWFVWFRGLLGVSPIAARHGAVTAVLAAPWACAALLFLVLRTVSAHDVRDDAKYLFFYQVFGAAWVGLAALLLPWFGFSARDDVAERRNAAAVPAIAGALLGLTLCFAGSNIGDGPGWWCVGFTAALATGTFFLLWFLVERTARVAESVVVERDLAAGLRVGGWLVGTGLVLGRAAAGNWTGPVAAAADFARVGWPAVVLAAVAITAEGALRPTVARPRPSWALAGLLPAALHLGVATAWVVATRPWS